MSARVVNPFSLNEMRRLREAVVARPVAFRPDAEARARVAKNLWGCASSAESRAFATRELEAQRERAADRWGFDFLREVPRNHGPGAKRYTWKPVRIGAIPKAYEMPRLNLDAVLETARATVPALHVREESQPQQPQATSTAEMSATPLTESPAVPLAMASPDLASPPSSSPPVTTSSTRQTTMKDFMVCRKRAISGKHKEGNPAKRARHEASSL